MKEPIIGLALGGGGALGMAHIGVLKALEEHGIISDIIVGTSIGSIVGGVYASGMSVNDMIEKALKVKTINLLDLNLNPKGMFSGKASEKTLKNILGNDFLIEDLPKKFACVAVDLIKGKEYVFKTGSLIRAIRSSISVPGLFVPNKVENMFLVDGGVLNNVPSDIVREMGADIVIAVNIVSDFIPYTEPKTLVHSVAFSFFIMQKELTNLKPKKYDVLLAPELKDFRQYSFSEKNTEALINKGYNETIKNIKKIKNKIEKFKQKDGK